MRGINLDMQSGVVRKDEELAEKLRRKRSLAARDKVKYEKEIERKLRQKVINFKGEHTELYTEEDKLRLAQGLKPDHDGDASSSDSSHDHSTDRSRSPEKQDHV